MKCTWLLVVLGIFSLLTQQATGAGTKVTGRVFHDQNRNLQLDPGEKGVAGVLVSNERDVVKTDQEGSYQLMVDEGAVLFITQPAGYDLPRNSRNLPQFYYLHYPAGSPVLRYPGIAPSGPLPGTLNFPLFSRPPADSFQVIVFSDPQPRSREEIGYIRDDVVAELVGSEAVCGIVLGDVMYDVLSLYDEYIEVIGQLAFPFFHVPGNHDMNYDVPDDGKSLETYKSHFGPAYYGFEYGKVHFIVLDNVEYLGQKDSGRGSYRGKIGKLQLQWLSQYLSFIPTDRLIVLTMHIPLYTAGGSNAAVRVADLKELFEILHDRRHLLALTGHMHMIEHQFLNPESGWHGAQPLHQIICGAVSGSWWSGPPDVRGIPVADQRDGAPNGYHLFTFQGNSFRENYIPAGGDREVQMRISRPAGSVAKSQLPATKIMVNVFDGNQKTQVSCQIDDRQPFHLTSEYTEDPYFVSLHATYPSEFPNWVKPEKSVHIWTAPLPADLKPGIHRIVVTSTNQWGERFQAARIFKIY